LVPESSIVVKESERSGSHSSVRVFKNISVSQEDEDKTGQNSLSVEICCLQIQIRKKEEEVDVLDEEKKLDKVQVQPQPQKEREIEASKIAAPEGMPQEKEPQGSKKAVNSDGVAQSAGHQQRVTGLVIPSLLGVAVVSLISFVNRLYGCVSEGRVAAAVSGVAAPVGGGIAMRSAKVERRVMSDDPVPRREGRRFKFKFSDESCYCFRMTDIISF
jgi:hypothetical protein